jgi:hypothetical protein
MPDTKKAKVLALANLFDFNGAPEEIRTPDPQIRSLVLYPAELRARLAHRAGSVLDRANPPGTRL